MLVCAVLIRACKGVLAVRRTCPFLPTHTKQTLAQHAHP